MTDVVGTLASCLDLTERIVEYISALRHREEDADKIMNRVAAAGNIIEILHELQKQTQSGPRQNAHWLRHLDKITSPRANAAKPLISDYEDLLKNINDKLEPIAGGSSLFRPATFLWPFKKGDIEAKVSQLTQLEISFQSVLQSILIQLAISNLKSDEEQSWLSNMSPSSQLKSLLNKSRSTPPNWIFADKIFNEWRAQTCNQVLWAQGNPGAGKSVLAASVVARLRGEALVASSKISVAALFYTYPERKISESVLSSTSSETVTLECMLRCVARQLLEQGGPELLRMPRVTEARNAASYDLGLPEITSLLIELWSYFDGGNFLVIDALDECADDKVRSTTVLHLKELLKQTPSLRVMVTSRPDMELYFPEGEGEYLCQAKRVNVAATDENVREHVSNMIEEIAKRPEKALSEADKKTRQNIVERSVNLTRGVFLLAVEHVRLLEEADTRHELEQTVANLISSDLGRIYDNIISRIRDQRESQEELAMRVLLWVVKGAQPLSIIGLQQALATYDSEGDLDNTRMCRTIHVVTYTKGLISIDGHTGHVKLVGHQTIQDYFSSKQKQKELFGKDADWKMAHICLKFISFSRFATQGAVWDIEYPFFPYAVKHWRYHLLKSD